MYLEKFTQQQQENLYKELNITEESLQRDVNYLIDWMGKQPHLPKVKGKPTIYKLIYSVNKYFNVTDSYLHM